MSVTSAIRELLAKGFTIEQALDAAEAFEPKTPTRSSGAIRQQRYRDRLVAERNGVTSDVTSDGMVSSSPPPKITNQTPSTPSSKPKPSARRSSLAEDAQPTAADGKEALRAGLSTADFRSEWRAFRDHHRSKGNLMADWSAAWRTWLRNSKRFTPASRASPTNRRPTVAERYAALISDPLDPNDDQSSHDGPTIDGTLASGPDESGGRYETAGAAEPPGTNPGRSMAATGYSAGYG